VAGAFAVMESGNNPYILGSNIRELGISWRYHRDVNHHNFKVSTFVIGDLQLPEAGNFPSCNIVVSSPHWTPKNPMEMGLPW